MPAKIQPLPGSAQSVEFLGSSLYGSTSFLQPFLESRPARILDLGCGNGFFTKLVSQTAPDAKITGTDINQSSVEYAQQNNFSSNISYIRGSFEATPLEDAQFDLIYCRFALAACKDISPAISEMLRLAKANARIVVLDMVHSATLCIPANPALAAVLEHITKSIDLRGGNADQGIHVLSAMCRAQLSNTQAKSLVFSSLASNPDYVQRRAFWVETLESLRSGFEPAIESSLIDSAINSFRTAPDNALFLETSIVTWGTKVN